MDDRTLEGIISTLNKGKQEMKKALPKISSEVNAIIFENNTNIERIEQVLNILLDYSQMGLGKAQFRKLNNYYASINAGHAKFYEDAFNGNLDDE